MSKLIEGQIECPFYIKEGDAFIACEGIVDGTTSVHRFKNNIKKAEYENKVCSCNGGRGCLHYRTVHTLYDKGLRA